VSGGGFKSTNAGVTWGPFGPGLEAEAVNALAIDPLTPSTLYAGTIVLAGDEICTYGVINSTDGAASWQPINADLSRTGTVAALAIDPLTPSTLYAGMRNFAFDGISIGAFKSTDGGTTWMAFNAGMGNLSVRALVIDPTMS